MTAHAIKQRQYEWATARALRPDDRHYLGSVAENLFQPLHPDTRAELEAGAGAELVPRARQKLRALHSSAALVCNMFDYWRGADISLLATACGADPGVTELRFERTYPTAAGGTPPHLDVVLSGVDARPTAIESKFLEPYAGRPTPVKPFYARAAVWDAVGLPSCGTLAGHVLEGKVRFELLGANQLLAHILGLATSHALDARLLYLWFDVGGDESARHRAEIERFADFIGPRFPFDARTYQQVFAEMLPGLTPHASYRDYLRHRYFAGES